MNWKQFIVSFLEERGMFPNQAQAVCQLVMDSKAGESMKDRWNDQVADYPEVIFKVITLTVKNTARQWIEENAPNAWFKSMFD